MTPYPFQVRSFATPAAAMGISFMMILSPALQAKAGEPGNREDASTKAILAEFRRTPPPTAEQITKAAGVAESFLTHAFADRAMEAVALMPPLGRGADLEVLPDAVRDFAQRHGALKSALLLRGRSLAHHPEDLQGEEPIAAELTPLWLFYLCTTDKGLHRAYVHLQQRKTGDTRAWKVVSAGSVPLEKNGWTVWEMAVNAVFAVAQRASGVAAKEWEPLFAAAEQEAKLVGVPLPPLPSHSGEPAIDLAAAKSWLMKAYSDALQTILPENGRSSVVDAWLAAVIMVRHAAGADESKALLAWMNSDDSPEIEPWIFAALKSDLSEAGFAHLMLCHASRFAASSRGFADDPLAVAIEYTDSRGFFPLGGKVTTKKFGGSLDSVVATVVDQARKAPGWEADVKLLSSVHNGEIHMVGSGDSLSVTYENPDNGTTRVIIIGADTWLRVGENGNWKKSSGSREERIFQTLTKKIFDAEVGRRHWFVNGLGNYSLGDPAWGKVSPDGVGVISNHDGQPVYGYYVMACKPSGPGTSLKLQYSLTTTAAGIWRLCGFELDFDMDQGDTFVSARSLRMTSLDKKPEIKAPSIPSP